MILDLFFLKYEGKGGGGSVKIIMTKTWKKMKKDIKN